MTYLDSDILPETVLYSYFSTFMKKKMLSWSQSFSFINSSMYACMHPSIHLVIIQEICIAGID